MNSKTVIFLMTGIAFAQVTQPSSTWVPSPNYTNSSRESTYDIDSIVIHTTEGSYSGAISWFQNPNAQVSAHYVISPEGAITQMVKDEDIAWHATYYNSRSIGIECAGYSAQASTWTPQLLASLKQLVAWLCKKYNIPVVHPSGNAYDYPNNTFDAPGLVAHAQVQPWNRTDPGPYFPWTQFVQDVKDMLKPPAPTGLSASGIINGSLVDVSFAWDAAPEATGYWLDIALSDSDLQNMQGTFQNFNTTATVYTVKGLQPGTTYYWRVYAYNSYGGSHGYPDSPYVTPSVPASSEGSGGSGSSSGSSNVSTTSAASSGAGGGSFGKYSTCYLGSSGPSSNVPPAGIMLLVLGIAFVRRLKFARS